VDDRGAVVGGADVTNIRRAKFLSAQPRQQGSQNDREIALGPISLAL
jgi:hypothetical protein